MKKVIFILFLILIASGVFFWISSKPSSDVVVDIPKDETNNINTSKPDVRNMTYEVDGDFFIMQDGKAEKPNEGLDSVNTLQVFGGPVFEDVDKDGDTDAALWLVNDPGGTGTFYYAALVVNDNGTFKPTNSVFLGDRISPQSLDFIDGHFVFNFMERGKDEPMSAEPTVAKSLWINYDAASMQIGEWVKDFEGDTNSSKADLLKKTWNWVSVLYNDDTKIEPKAKDKFKVTFKDDNTFSASTDCNGIGGNYKVVDGKITFSDMLGTLMYCEGSQEADFRKVFEEAQSFFFDKDGRLVIELKFDSGSAIFN